MRILGIDPGLRTTGFGVVDSESGRLRYVASGTIQTGAVAIGELPRRLKIIFDGVREVTARYRPDCAAVEIVFVNVNPQSTLLLGQARGAAICAAVLADLPVTVTWPVPEMPPWASSAMASTPPDFLMVP